MSSAPATLQTCAMASAGLGVSQGPGAKPPMYATDVDKSSEPAKLLSSDGCKDGDVASMLELGVRFPVNLLSVPVLKLF